MLFAMIRHELKLTLANGSGVLNVFAFFVIAVTLFAFGVGPDPALMEPIAPSIIWVCALLTAMLSLPSVFARDYEDGTLEQLLIQGHIIEKVVMAKILAHWIFTSLPLILIAPVLGYMLQMDSNAIMPLVISLLLGSPVFSLIGSMGASLALGTRRAAALLGILVLPFYIPVLIFGISASAQEHTIYLQNSFSPFLILLGLLLLMLPVCIFATSLALRAAIEED